MKKMKSEKAIIFDLRYGSYGTMFRLSKFLNKNRYLFAKFTKPDYYYPGVFKWLRGYNCGKKNNKKFYKGKVILLVNESTQSHDEFNCMALQTAPDVKCIGSQTAGADGNVKTVTFPGGDVIYYSSIGVYYPNGKETQRIGIIPDIEVKQTAEGIRKRKDEILERTIEYIKTGK